MKTFCLLSQGNYINEPLTLKLKKLFTTDFSDFYRLNWKYNNDPHAVISQQNITWSEGRCILYEHIPKKYEYYIFIDDDIDFITHDETNIPAKIRDLLMEYKPLSGTFISNSSWYLSKEAADRAIASSTKCFPIYIYDQQLQIYSSSFADVMLPCVYHGCAYVFVHAMHTCHRLFPLKQVCFTDISIINTRHEVPSWQPTMWQWLNRFQIYDLCKIHAIGEPFEIGDGFEGTHQHVRDTNLNILQQKRAVDKTKITFQFSDLQKVYNTNNYFFRNRMAKLTFWMIFAIKIKLLQMYGVKFILEEISNLHTRMSARVPRLLRRSFWKKKIKSIIIATSSREK